MNKESNEIVSVAAVVLNYRRAGDTIACVRSLTRSEGIRPDIVVVDNGSGDGSADRVASEFPGLELIRNRENFGYAGGNNIGIRRALERGADFVFVVNNDCIVAPDAIRRMLEAARSAGAGIVSPKIYDFSNPETIQYAGYRNIHILAQGVPVGEGERDEGQYEEAVEMSAAPGCALLLSGRLCEAVGLFDERFFAYSEELDLCRRALMKGFRILFEPGAHVWHKKAATLNQKSPEYTYFLARGRILYARKHLGWAAFIFVFVPYFLVVKFARQILFFLFTGRWKNIPALFRAVSWNLRNGR